MQELIKALIKARSEFAAIAKDRVNPHYKNRYATLDAVLAAVEPALCKHGLTIIQTTEIEDDRAVLSTHLFHESGDFITGKYPLPSVNTDSQKMGAALTYARRYSVCAILSITADEDDDGNGAGADQKPQDQVPSLRPVGKTISEAQSKRLWAIARNSGYGVDGVKALLADFGFFSKDEITNDKYERLCAEAENTERAAVYNEKAKKKAESKAS